LRLPDIEVVVLIY